MSCMKEILVKLEERQALTEAEAKVVELSEPDWRGDRERDRRGIEDLFRGNITIEDYYG